ncbi:MAG: hypothetical protein LBD29_02165 [Treponema sp.]|nr:hypothetical protein [Treponema sp.]
MVMMKDLIAEIESLPGECLPELSGFIMRLKAKRTQRSQTSAKKIHLTKTMKDSLLKSESLRSLTGLLHTSLTDAEIRAERLKKYECID